MVNEVSNFIKGNVAKEVKYRVYGSKKDGCLQIVLKSPFLNQEEIKQLSNELNQLAKEKNRNYIFM